MRLTNEDLKEVYHTHTGRGERIEWLLSRKDQLKITDEDSMHEFIFIQEELCKLIGARIIILATPEELT